MGIGTSILTKIGIPLGLLAAAGVILYTFKDPITTAIKGGASTVGQALTIPIAGILEGAKEGLSQIPAVIDIPIPRFNIAFAEGQDPAAPIGVTPPPNVPSITEKGFDFEQALVNLCRNSAGLLCFQEKQQQEQEAEAIKLTRTNVGRAFDVGTSSDKLGRMTTEQILKEYPQAVGLFDVISTKGIEYFPLSAEEVISFEKYGGAGEQLKLSGQIYKEIPNVRSILGA